MMGYEIRHMLTKHIEKQWPDAMISQIRTTEGHDLLGVEVTFRTYDRGHLEDYTVDYMVDTKEKKIIPARFRIRAQGG